MPIQPPSMPSVSLRDSTFSDDSALALQAIAAEQSIAGLQKLGSSSEQLLASISRQQATSRTIEQLQEGRNSLQRSELIATQAALSEVSGIGADPPSNLAELQTFLADRGLPADLTTETGREQAIAALNGYVDEVRGRFDAVDNPAIRQQISDNSGLQQALRDANSLLGANESFPRPEDLAGLNASLASETARLAQLVRQQVSEVVQGAQQAIVLSTDNAILGSQLVAATSRGQQLAAVRLEAAQRELEQQTYQLNQSVRELASFDTAASGEETSQRLASLVDQVKGSSRKVQAALAILMPDAAIAAMQNAAAIDQRIYQPTTSIATNSSGDATQANDRAPRLLDPSRLV